MDLNPSQFDLGTAEKSAKWQKSNSALMVVAVVALVGFLVLLLLIGVFNVAVPFWAWLFVVPLIVVARFLQMRTRWQMLKTAESAHETQATQLTDNTLRAAQADHRAKKRRP